MAKIEDGSSGRDIVLMVAPTVLPHRNSTKHEINAVQLPS